VRDVIFLGGGWLCIVGCLCCYVPVCF